MSIFQETTPEEEEEVINKAYKIIKKRGLDTAALLILRGFGPFAPLGGSLGRFFLGPITPFMGHREEKIIWTLEKTENLDKLIKMLEKDIEESKKKDEKNKNENVEKTNN
jgi:hypothetical protein